MSLSTDTNGKPAAITPPLSPPENPTTHAFSELKSDSWSVEKSAATYGINNWGSGYFRINQNGNVSVTPKGADGYCVDLYELTQELQDRGIRIPIMIRFPDIIRERVNLLNDRGVSRVVRREDRSQPVRA